MQAVESAKRAGAFDFGVEEIRARNLQRIGEQQTLHLDESSGARTMLHELEGEIDVDRRTFVDVASSHHIEGFFRNCRSERIYAVSPHMESHPNEVLLAAVKGPRHGMDRRELAEKYEEVDPETARAWWDAEYARTPNTEPQRFHILSGAIFVIYDKIMGSSGIQSVKIARAILADGTALVGLNLAASDVPSVKQRLGIGTPLAEATPEDILNLVMGGANIELDNGWRLSTARISGDEVIELVLNGVPANRTELKRYGLSDEIIYHKRRWFVVPELAEPVLACLVDRHHAVRDITNDPNGREGDANPDSPAANEGGI